jgi:hypothetical protein
MLGDPYLMMGQAQKEKVVLGAQFKAQKPSTRTTPQHRRSRRWVDLLSLVRVQRLNERGRA